MLRADAGNQRGTGHVMRCLTLAEALTQRGHHVELMTSEHSVSWLNRLIKSSGLPVLPCALDELDPRVIDGLRPDWLVIDSYTIDATMVSEINATTPTLVIVDGDRRSIEASLFLDQNLGADEAEIPPDLRIHILAGSQFALIRDAVLEQRRASPWEIENAQPHIVVFMGGTDPFGATAHVAEQLNHLLQDVQLSIVCPDAAHDAIKEALSNKPRTRLLDPTDDLPAVLGGADVVISAAGTSAWEICTLAIPSVLVAVADNQRESLQQALESRVTLGLDTTSGSVQSFAGLDNLVDQLLRDHRLRQELSANCRRHFDGNGKVRVAKAMERGAGA